MALGAALLAGLLGSMATSVQAATVAWQLRVKDGEGRPLADTVVELSQPGAAAGTPRETSVVQRNKTLSIFSLSTCNSRR